ncbi:MAG TPA: type III-B CRISPR module RAMP protein Cmr4 [Ktedonobacteraceae bacterium]|nr:type III-B CRISPR module RAMP protein Cmr4 [Ktedonobacteraceae bacterium]
MNTHLAHLTFVHALSRLHAGTGQGAGVIDLPIAREKATGLPFLPGSSLKGALRARCSVEKCQQVFGPDPKDIQTDSNHASSTQFSDQRLLLLPIRSLVGTFAWVTSPYILRRLARDIQDAEIIPQAECIPNIPEIPEVEMGIIASGESKIRLDTPEPKVFLEDLELNALPNKDASTWATWIGKWVFSDDQEYQQMLIERMCIVHDDVFSFLVETATEINAHIKLKEDTKTVQDGGLWYEESLPAETILSGIVLATPTSASGILAEEVFQVLQRLTGKTLQLGGKATTGHGICRVQFAEEAKKGAIDYAHA